MAARFGFRRVSEAHAALVGAEIRLNLVVHLVNPLIFTHTPSRDRRGGGLLVSRGVPSRASQWRRQLSQLALNVLQKYGSESRRNPATVATVTARKHILYL